MFKDSEQQEAINIDTLVNTFIAELRPEITRKQINLVTRIEDTISVQANHETLSILLRNLVDNAVKYVPEQGCVEISTEQSDNHVTFTISDNGAGLSSDQKSLVFERFIGLQIKILTAVVSVYLS